jgi:hypothetical protein
MEALHLRISKPALQKRAMLEVSQYYVIVIKTAW